MTLAHAPRPVDDLLEAYRAHTKLMPVSADYQRTLVRAAEGFIGDHPDLNGWMARAVQVRLVELSRRPDAWPVIGFALLSGRCRSDLEFLIASGLDTAPDEPRRSFMPTTSGGSERLPGDSAAATRYSRSYLDGRFLS